MPRRPDSARSLEIERGKPDNYLQGHFIPGLIRLSTDEQRELAQKPCWCIGCAEITEWQLMRWDGPLLLCQGCIHLRCKHTTAAAVSQCEQLHYIRSAHWVDPWSYETVRG